MTQNNTARKPMLLALWHHHPFHVNIAVLFTALVFLVGTVLVWSSYLQGRSVVLSAAEDVFDRIERESSSQLLHLRAPVEVVMDLMSKAPITGSRTFDQRMQSVPAIAEVLNRQSMLDSIYIGYDNGDFFQVSALRDDAAKKRINAPQQAAFRVQSIERAGGLRVRFLFLDVALNNLSERAAPPEYRFDPRARPWYVDALQHAELVRTAPYVFFTTREVGQTIARRVQHGRAVVGADLNLSRLSAILAHARPSPTSQLAIFGADGGVLAYSEPVRLAAAGVDDTFVLARISDLSPVLAAAAADLPRFAKRAVAEVGGREWLIQVVPTVQSGNQSAYLAVAMPSDELLTVARAGLQRQVWLMLVLIVLTVPLTWLVARRIAGNLKSLTDQAAAIRRFNFDTPAPIRTRVNEIFGLGRAMGQMRETIRKFRDITTALSAERKFDRLLQRVLKEAHDAAGADGGVVYLLDDDGRMLKPAAQAWDAGAAVGLETLPALTLQDATNPVAHAAARHTTTSHTHGVPAQRPPGLEFLDAHFGAVPVILVTVPLLNRAGAVIGMLCVFLPGSVEPPSPERLALVEAFAGAGAAAIDNQRLLLAHKALLDALIALVAGAIDAKSPYTGGHCERVPDLTYMLTRAACAVKEGPFAEFDLDEEGWEALHIAGGLHDCGKVTTPEFVVDKATKLETIYDRIHEVRMRFEVLKRDAEIACLGAIAAGGDAAGLRAALVSQLRTLDAEFAFVAGCNIGGEFMAPEKVERLKTIAARTWQRTLDDRIGVSWEENQRMARTPAASLPATERLLADKPEHIIERGTRDLMPADNSWGFKLDMPVHMYDRGELHNLAIARGTLTEEERYKINDHIVQTIIMLSRLPFPGHLKAVPELAGGHHEKMDGTGYPKRLQRNDMSVQARIMAIADIFEALTAADRPYKKAKMLSEALRIMSFMKKDRHIDPDLFDLFLRSGVYREYADKYLKPEYIDEIDLKAYLGAPAAG